MTTLHRRDWLNIAAAAGWAAATGQAFAADDIPVIDTHVHLWDVDKFTLPWLGAKGSGPLARSFLISDYLEAIRGQNVTKGVYMEVDVAPDQALKEAEYIVEMIRSGKTPLAAAVVSGQPGTEGFAAHVKALQAMPEVKGLRRVLHSAATPPGTCTQPAFLKSLQLLGDAGLTFDFCMRPADLGDAVQAAEKCPRTRFILDHCGNMPVEHEKPELRAAWEKSIRNLAALPNTIAKISGIAITAKKNFAPDDLASVINFVLDAFGEDRVIFAADWPVCTLNATFAQWTDAVKVVTRNRSTAFRRKLFHDNAAKLYGLK